MNQTLEHINLINKQKTAIKNLLKEITKNQLTYEIYNTNDYSEYIKIKKNEEIISDILKGCFSSKQSIHQSHGTWFITKLDNVIVGCLLVIFEVFNPWIWNVCRNVKPQYNGYAIGENLMKYTLDYLKINYPQYKEIYLWAAQKPVSRTNFYKSIGFKEMNIKDSYGNPKMVYKQS